MEYDLVIIGGGPAGLAAGLCGARSGLRTLLLEKGVMGGQIATTDLVENYPGFPDGVMGFDLGQLMHQQAERQGIETGFAEATGIELEDKLRVVKTSEGDHRARAVIIASGAEHTKLGVPGEKELTGKGVSYCAVCDGAFFRDQAVAVVGGGDSALTEALFLTRFAQRIIVIHRREQLRATRLLQERARANPKMEFRWNAVVEAIEGDGVVRQLRLRDVKTGQGNSLEVSGVFIYVGLRPNTEFLGRLLPLDATGHILANERMETGVPGLWAVGDVRQDSARQAVTAAADGARAALAVERYLRGL